MSGTNTTQANTGNSDPLSSSGTPDTFLGLLQSLTVDGKTGLLDFIESSDFTLEEKVRFAVTVLEDNGHDTTRIDWNDSDSEASAASPMKVEILEKPTIFSRKIFSLVTNEKIDDAVEDYILTDPTIQANDPAVVSRLLTAAAENPMKSYLAKSGPNTIEVDALSLSKTENYLLDWIDKQNIIISNRNSDIRNIQNDILPKARKERDEAQKYFEDRADIVSAHESQLAEYQSDGFKERNELQDKNLDLKAVIILKQSLETLHDVPPEQLPYANIKTPEEVRNLASCFGVTDKESIPNLRQDDHKYIAEACGLFGYRFSPAFKLTGLTSIRFGAYHLPEMQEQTAKLFLLFDQDQSRKRGRDYDNEVGVHFPSPKKARLTSAMKAAKKKYRTPDKTAPTPNKRGN